MRSALRRTTVCQVVRPRHGVCCRGIQHNCQLGFKAQNYADMAGSAASQDSVDVQVDVREPLITRSVSDGVEGEEFCEEDAIAR